MNNKVIYTSLVGGYDILANPKYIMPNWDYICFSNDVKQHNDSVWEIRPIPYHHSNKTILSRYPKMNPHKLLKDYEFSLWIDASLVILDSFLENRINELINSGITLSQIPHPERNCIYEEAKICIEKGLDRRNIIEKQINFLKKENYPENNGLFENGVIFRKHNHPIISLLCGDWWDLYLKFSKRDQLSLGYLFWKHNIHCEPFTQKGFSVRNIPSFSYSAHNKTLMQRSKIYLQRIINNYI